MPTWTNQKTIKDSKGSNMTYQQCNDWAWNDVNDCKNNPPSNNIWGWIKCAQGSDPSTTSCSSATKDFSCAWGQNCFAINDYSGNWSSPKTGITPHNDQITFQKCTNWPADNPQWCSDTKPKGTVDFTTCAVGLDPTAAGCTRNQQSCVIGQDCYAITTFTPSDSTTFSGPFTGCDGNDKVVYYSCDNWKDNQPSACSTSKNAPKDIKAYKVCGLASSPSGLVPNKTGTACPVPRTSSNTCLGGQECYPMASISLNDSECMKKNEVAQNLIDTGNNIAGTLSNVSGLLSGTNSIYTYMKIIAVIIVIIVFISIVGYIYKSQYSYSSYQAYNPYAAYGGGYY